MKALVVEGAYRSRGALAAVRGLGAAGWEVGVGAAASGGLAGASRWARHRHAIVARETSTDGFVESVAEVVERHGYDVVLPAGDGEALALSAARAGLGRAVPYGPHDGVLRCFDKRLMNEAAAVAGVRVPRTEAGTVEALEAFDGPVVVKTRVYWEPDTAAPQVRVETEVFDDKADAAERIRGMRAMGGEALVQEVVRGPLIALSMVRDRRGRIVGMAQQQSEHLWPGPTGISARAETTSVDDTLRAGVTALLDELEWVGLAQAQFLAPETGPPCLIDLNGRLYGSLALAIGAGANLPALWASVGVGAPLPDEPVVARPGVRYHWLPGDLRRVHTLRERVECLRYAPGAVHSVWSARDPRPALAYLTGGLGRMARR